VTTAPGDEGAVLQAIYSNEPSDALPLATEQRIAAFELAAPIVNGWEIELEFRDGLRGSFGAVNNLIEEDGRAVSAKLTPKRVETMAPKNYTPPAFSLRFDGPFALEGEPGKKVRGDFRCLLNGIGDAERRLEAWSIGVIARGGNIVGIAVRGTDAEQALATGFVRNEVTTGAGNEGAVSTVIYSLTEPQSLLVLGEKTLAALEVEADVPEAGTTLTLQYNDGLVGESGPVENAVVAAGGITHRPIVSRARASVLSSQRCGDVAYAFALENVDSPIAFEGVVGGTRSQGEIDVPVSETGEGTVEVYAVVVSMFGTPVAELCEGKGTSGWSFAIALEGDAEPVDGSFEDTAAERYMSTGSAIAAIVDAEQNGGRQGFTSGVILNFQCFSCLPAAGTVASLRMRIQSKLPPAVQEASARLFYADSLQVPGGTIGNTYMGLVMSGFARAIPTRPRWCCTFVRCPPSFCEEMPMQIEASTFRRRHHPRRVIRRPETRRLRRRMGR
jgi:hypothetical protein